MSSSKKVLLVSSLSVFALCLSLQAEARHSKSDAKKPSTDAGQAADKAAAPASGTTDQATPPGDKPGDKAGTPPAAAGSAAPPQSAAGPPGQGAPAAPAPPPVAAAPKELSGEVSLPKQEAAKAHFMRGVELYTNGDFPNAWLEFNSAYQIVPLVDLLNNLARCEVRMGRLQNAIEHYKNFISARPSDPDSEYIRQEIARLEGEMGRGPAPGQSPLAEPTAPAPPPPPRRIPIYGIMAGVTTVAMLIAGAATLGLVNSRYNQLQGGCAPSCAVPDVNVLQTQSYAGYGLLGVAGAGAVATGLLFYFELRNNKESSLRPIARLSSGTPSFVLGRY